jgi:hypothetical protein
MSMGNLLGATPLGRPEMATTESTVGIDHLTDVPENFDGTDARADESGTERPEQ